MSLRVEQTLRFPIQARGGSSGRPLVSAKPLAGAAPKLTTAAKFGSTTAVPAARQGEPVKTLRVLVLEDDALIGMLLAEMLEGMGHDVCAVEATEADAVRAAIRCGPDMMVVDARLGVGSGISAVEKVCLAGFVPHLFVTGDVLGVLALRPDAVVIQKPFREGDLARAIERALAAAVA